MEEEIKIHLIPVWDNPLIELLLIADPSRSIVEEYATRGQIFGAFKGDELVGALVLIKTRPQTLEIVNVVVREAYQRKGIAKKMINFALDKAKTMKFKTVEIGTGNPGVDQLALYQKCGFRITGVDRDFFTRHYEEAIFENGIACVDMLRLSQDLEDLEGMKVYPNYRVAVEIVVKRAGKVLLMKRATNCDVAPGSWCVPAGKVKYEEIPSKAVLRECKEETGFDVRGVKELECRTFKDDAKEPVLYRLVYTYLVELLEEDTDSFTMNEEHSHYAWVDKEEIEDIKYNSLLKALKDIIINKVL